MYRLKLFCIFVLAVLSACSQIEDKTDEHVLRANVARAAASADDDTLTALIAGNTDFAFDLYHQVAENGDGNFILSPYSISLAFAMLYAGATDDAAAQIAETFHFELPPEQLHPAFNTLDQMLHPLQEEEIEPTATPEIVGYRENPADDLVLHIANSLWIHEDFPLEEPYLETLARDYDAGLHTVDFAGNTEETRQLINQWIREATRDKITDMPPEDAISSTTRLALLNAIYFKGEWTYPFTERNTYEGAFHLADDSEVTVPMMVNDFAYMQCVRSEAYHAIELTYGKSENSAMMIIMPDTGNFDDIENNLGTEFFHMTLEAFRRTNLLTFTMPRFEFETDVDLKTNLVAMGLTAPFNDLTSFKGISANDLLIDYAEHKATISVNEQGTEASGSTVISMYQAARFTECDREVRADRPFIFAIYDVHTDTILFLGRVMNPEN